MIVEPNSPTNRKTEQKGARAILNLLGALRPTAYEYTYLVDKDSDSDPGDGEPLDIADGAPGPEDGEGDISEVDSLVFASL